MFKKILVPLDGSQTAEQALDLSLQIIDPGGDLILLRVPVPDYTLTNGGLDIASPEHHQRIRAAREEAENYLDAVQARIERGDLSVRPKIVEGEAASVIVDTAEAEDVDLLVMSTHGRTALRRWMLGGVAERALRYVSRPTLVVRAPKPIETIVVTLDGSELAERVLAPALAVAERLDAQVTLLRVAERHPKLPSDPTLSPETRERIFGDPKAYLEAIIRDKGLEERATAVVLEGVVAHTVVDYLEAENTDMLALVTHGFTGSRRWAYGSVAEKMLRAADCSLLVLRPPEHELTEYE